MAKPNKKEIFHEFTMIRPVYLASRIFGLSPYLLYAQNNKMLHKQSSMAKWLSWSYLMIVIILTWSVIEYQARTLRDKRSDHIAVYGDILRTDNSIIMAIVLILSKVANRVKVGRMMRKLKNVDDAFYFLNICIDYKKASKMFFIAISFTYSTMIVILLADFILFTEAGDVLIVIYWIECVLTFMVNVTGTVQFLGYLYTILARYRALNQFILNISRQTVKGRRKLSHISDVAIISTKQVNTVHFNGKLITCISKIHDRLCTATQILNSAYCVFLLLMANTSFTVLVIQLYLFYLMMSTNEKYQLTYGKIWTAALWGTLFFLGMFAISYFCSAIKDEAGKSGIYMHTINVSDDDVEARSSLEMFSMQTHHQKVRFTACGFFYVDLTLLYMIIGAVVSYLIFLIQFEMADRSMAIKTINANKNNTES